MTVGSRLCVAGAGGGVWKAGRRRTAFGNGTVECRMVWRDMLLVAGCITLVYVCWMIVSSAGPLRRLRPRWRPLRLLPRLPLILVLYLTCMAVVSRRLGSHMAHTRPVAYAVSLLPRLHLVVPLCSAAARYSRVAAPRHGDLNARYTMTCQHRTRCPWHAGVLSETRLLCHHGHIKFPTPRLGSNLGKSRDNYCVWCLILRQLGSQGACRMLRALTQSKPIFKSVTT
jgi:hypothetical protein